MLVELIKSNFTPSVVLPYVIDLITSTRETHHQRPPKSLSRPSKPLGRALANLQSQSVGQKLPVYLLRTRYARPIKERRTADLKDVHQIATNSNVFFLFFFAQARQWSKARIYKEVSKDKIHRRVDFTTITCVIFPLSRLTQKTWYQHSTGKKETIRYEKEAKRSMGAFLILLI